LTPDTDPAGFDVRILGALAVTLTLWASAYVAIRAGLAGYAAGHLVLLRFVVAAAALGVWAAFRRPRLPAPGEVPLLLAQGIVGYFGYHVALTFGERTVSAGSACFIVGFIPVFTALLSAVFLGERLGVRTAAGITVAMAGVTMIALGEAEGGVVDPGAGLVLLAALCSAVFYVWQKPVLRRWRPMEYTCWAMWLGALPMLAFAPGLPGAVAAAPLEATLAVVYLGVFPAAVAYGCWTYVLSRAPVSRVAPTQYAMPVMTIAIGFVWLGEVPDPLALVGGAVALAGVVVVNARPGMPWGASLRRRAGEGREKGWDGRPDAEGRSRLPGARDKGGQGCSGS
jgi:drug/metabolite transporter (DMT)-like permease